MAIQHFEDLEIWKEARSITREKYTDYPRVDTSPRTIVCVTKCAALRFALYAAVDRDSGRAQLSLRANGILDELEQLEPLEPRLRRQP